MANDNLSFNCPPGTHLPGTAHAVHAGCIAARMGRGFCHGLLALVLILPAAAWASGPEPANAPDRTPGERPRRPASAAADGQLSPGPVPAPPPPSREIATARDGSGATMAARPLPAPTARAAQRDAPSPRPDFLFGQPRISFGLRGLWHRARAGSDFYDFVNEELFAPRSPEDDHDNPDHGLLNFDAPGISFDFGYGFTSRLDLRVGVDYAKSLNESELRNWIGEDGLPYTQFTELSQTDVRAELVFALAPRGRAIGQYAWIPSRVVPYVGAGLGFVRHDLIQAGEFVDEIGYFEGSFTSKGWGTGIHLFGGADIRMTRHAFLNVEVRHVEASAGLGDDFAGFDPLDLGGLRIGTGVRFVF